MAENDVVYLDTMNEVLVMTLGFLEDARTARNDVRMGAYLKMASRSLRCAMEIYGDHLSANRAEMKQGENLNGRLSI